MSVAVVEIAPNGAAKKSRTYGIPSGPVSLRSAAKPFQVLPLFNGAAERFDVTPQEIALACASHNSEVTQVHLIRGFLNRLALAEDVLACGPHRSLFNELGIWQREGKVSKPPLEEPSAVASNCSGKHTAMLAVAVASGDAPKNYYKSTHSVQHGCRESVRSMADVTDDAITSGVDGCGVVCFGVPLDGIALAFARLTVDSEPTRTVFSAMTSYPELVAGARRTCTAIMRAFPGQIAVKIGAGGVYGAAFLEQKIGLALKVHDGNAAAASAALLAVSAQLHLLPGVQEDLPDYAEPAIVNTRREIVGKYEAVGTLGMS